ncbi:bifunctional serine/threonine-protein kinase/glutamate ABC transporter substrate-binding protein [Streptomyces zagrosensis]|uniref:bifunctional serine/threonine-protein kinase/glutamate ABC transporter substrate-binding protein n=1 Tax=Streptomyces zagrosensis TaxID=1042984 RepID=UPI00161A8D16|nr:bifunctional serine/threonine-protein kinase/glutamate ABC transporter substrate-binding protein [Streptomyces zagrosensis]
MIDGRFQLVERLGGGGMGTVWRARDLALDRDVALKEVRPPDPALAEADPAGAQQLRARVLREARALARISHPHVVTIYHIVDGAEHAYPWLVMELIAGENVQDRLARGPLAPVDAAALGRGVLAGLVAVHAAGIQHRDVKPANVLIRPDGHPVLTDFGIAAIQGSTMLTAAGSMIGTPEYMAPERAAGQDGDAAADLWSLGMMLYVAVEGRHPMRRANTLATLAAIVGEDVPPPRTAGTLTTPLQALLSRDPGARPDATALDRLLAAVAAEAHKPASAESASAESASAESASAEPTSTAPAPRAAPAAAPDSPAPSPGVAPLAAPGPHSPSSAAAPDSYHLAPPEVAPRLPAPSYPPPTPTPYSAPLQATAPPQPAPRTKRIWLYASGVGAAALAGALIWVLLPDGGSDNASDRPSQGSDSTATPTAPGAESPAHAGTETGNGEKITIGVKADQPGLGLRQLDGSYAGLDIDVAKYIARSLGIKDADITWKEVHSSNRESVLAGHKADFVVATYTINASRSQQIDFAGPYLTAHQDVLLAADNTSVHGPSDLNGKKVCSAAGSSPAARLKSQIAPQAQLVEYDSYAKCIDALSDGKVDAVTTDDAILAGYAAQQPGAFRLAGLKLSDEPYGVGLPKDSPLKGKVEKALTNMTTDGAWDQAVQKNVPLLAS